MMSDAKSLVPNEYASKVKEISAKWKQKNKKEEKEPYVVQARFEQQARDDLAKQPLPLKGDGKSDLEMLVGRHGCSKLSGKRLSVNMENFRGHSAWSAPTQLGDGTMDLHC